MSTEVSLISDDDALRGRFSAAILRIRRSHPFFGALALFAEFRIDDAVETAATDGKIIFVAREFAARLSSTEMAGLLLHEVLHCALEHIRRRGPRNPNLWNVAADIVVNGMIRGQTEFALPEGSIEMPKLTSLSTEAIYRQLAKYDSAPACSLKDLTLGTQGPAGALSVVRAEQYKEHWSAARRRAGAIARCAGIDFGKLGGGEWRDFRELLDPELDWKTLLWQFVGRTPTDYSGFDRRFIGRGLYLEGLESESLDLRVAVDTSGSISREDLTRFLSELNGILRLYPMIEGKLYFADADLHGPHTLPAAPSRFSPKGGGGTSFRPFFREIMDDIGQALQPAIVVYLTDGYGDFPEVEPEIETLWVVTHDGRPAHEFPFGLVIRMTD